MVSARLYIAVPCHNRKAVVEQCLPTIAAGKEPNDLLVGYNDGSTEYGPGLLMTLGADHFIDHPHIGIEAGRRRHFTDFIARKEFTHLYLTDADALHDPLWRIQALALQARYFDAPICLYNTAAHERMQGNTWRDNPDESVIWRRFAPGISHLLTRDHCEKVVAWLQANPTAAHWNWDWTVPAILNYQFGVSRVSYVDHLGKGGYHHPEDEGWDGGDRALNPTTWLVEKRQLCVQALQS